MIDLGQLNLSPGAASFKRRLRLAKLHRGIRRQSRRDHGFRVEIVDPLGDGSDAWICPGVDGCRGSVVCPRRRRIVDTGGLRPGNHEQAQRADITPDSSEEQRQGSARGASACALELRKDFDGAADARDQLNKLADAASGTR
jgi:hypothetical protein